MESGDQLRFRFQQVEGRQFGLGKRADKKDDQRSRHNDTEPAQPEVKAAEMQRLHFDYLAETHRTGEQYHCQDGKHQRNLVAQKLSHHTKAGQQGVFVVAAPAGHQRRHDAY